MYNKLPFFFKISDTKYTISWIFTFAGIFNITTISFKSIKHHRLLRNTPSAKNNNSIKSKIYFIAYLFYNNTCFERFNFNPSLVHVSIISDINRVQIRFLISLERDMRTIVRALLRDYYTLKWQRHETSHSVEKFAIFIWHSRLLALALHDIKYKTNFNY